MRIFNFNQFTISEGMVSFSEITDTTYSNLRLNGIVKSDQINQDLLDDINQAAIAAGVKCFVTTGRSDHPSAEKPGSSSNHRKGMAVDVSRVGYDSSDWSKILSNRGPQSASESDPEYIDAGTKLAIELINLGYGLITSDESIKSQLKEKGMGSALKGSEGQKGVIWRTMTGGNHYNHLHISRQLDAGDTSGGSKISSDDIKVSEPEPTIGQRIKSFFGFGDEDKEKPKEAIKESNSDIITNLKITESPVPVLIAHTSKDQQEKLEELLTQQPDLLNNFVLVIPKDSETSSKDILSDVSKFLSEKKSSMLNLSVIFTGRSSDSQNFKNYTKMDNLLNVLLINPPPKSSVMKMISETKGLVFVTLDTVQYQKLYGDKDLTTFKGYFEKILKDKALEVDKHYKEFTDKTPIDLIQSSVNTFKGRMISRSVPKKD